MYLKIRKIDVVPDKWGSHLAITMVGLYEDNGKYVKFVKLADIAETLKETKIPYDPSAPL